MLQSTEGETDAVRLNLWDEPRDRERTVFLPLKNQLVDFQGLTFNSPEYHHARLQRNRRRLQHFARGAVAAAANDTHDNSTGSIKVPPHLARLRMMGSVLDGTFYVQLGLGSPQQPVQVTFDTGSSVFWVNCNCGTCPTSSTIITLNPYQSSASSTSHTLPCNNQCLGLQSHNPGAFGCVGSQCGFQVKYGDKSTANGGVIKDVVSMPATDDKGGYISAPVYFGCGSNQSGLFLEGPTLDGLLGMGNAPDAMLAQLSAQRVLPQVFSFCLDNLVEDGSHAILGRGPAPKTILRTPLVQNPSPTLQVSYYYVGLQGITIGNNLIDGSNGLGQISPDTGSGGVIVDSGTTLTNVPALVYQGIIAALNAAVPQYAQLSTGISPQNDLCTSYVPPTAVNDFPDIVMQFAVGEWRVQPTTYLYVPSYGPFGVQFCLGLMSSQPGTVPSAIIGESWMTDTFIQIDVVDRTLGWAPLDCASGQYFGVNATAVPAPPSAAPSRHFKTGLTRLLFLFSVLLLAL